MTGIIPARAGFTRARRLAGHGREDHPRSRGVYPTGRIRRPRMSGSSPLARGLPSTTTAAHASRRIIPARAGFTPDRRLRAPRPGDHPRSRGVYWATCSWPRAATGSSPLARGLHNLDGDVVLPVGIIPARAGFTSGLRASSTGTTDHPRSRGVYSPSRAARWRIDGSSPLARGLHTPQSWVDSAARIIPARAGFTYECVAGGDHDGDHPRSRGVYSRSAAQAAEVAGSSPLARGLRRPGVPQATGPVDHPRSRGVYRVARAARFVPSGSSPLAWGFRRAGRRVRAPPRLTPAPAGFTRAPASAPRAGSDHPRSRGVYSGPVSRPRAPAGSSPLARGLPVGR